MCRLLIIYSVLRELGQWWTLFVQIILGHKSLAVRSHKRTSKDLEQNVSSVLYGNATNNKKMCISAGYAAPVEFKEVTKETLKCRGLTDDQENNKAQKNPFSVTINFNINS